MATFPLDQPVRLDFNTYSDATRTTLADATSVVLSVKDPTGTETLPAVTHVSTGLYRVDYTPAAAGHYQFHWTATGAVASSEDGEFDVRPKYGSGFVTVDDVRTEINETSHADDDEIQTFIDAAVEVVENIVGPVTPKSYTEWKDGGSTTLILDRYPVVTVDSVTEYVGTTAQTLTAEPLGSATYTDLGYRVDLATGVLTRFTGGSQTVFNRGTGNVAVAYTAGRTSIPGNIRSAALDLIRHLWNRSQVGPAPTFGIPGALEPGTTMVAGYAVPNAVVELLQPHRKAPHV